MPWNVAYDEDLYLRWFELCWVCAKLFGRMWYLPSPFRWLSMFTTMQKAWASSFPPTYFHDLVHERHSHAETALLECRYYEACAE